MSVSTPVSILGATGTVGQKLIALIEAHPNFHVAEVAASDRNKDKKYTQACEWREPIAFPTNIANLTLKGLTEVNSPFALSALPSDIAKEVEPALAAKGIHVISNASAFRMDSNVPLIIPEVNSAHIQCVKEQATPGKILTNPNCVAIPLSMGLAPLVKMANIKHVCVTTLQALSGAGYPGVPSFDLIGNIIPNIGGAEEEKILQETQKILGNTDAPAQLPITVQVNRVPVVHGHTVSAHVFFDEDISAEKVIMAFEQLEKEMPNSYKLHLDNFRPQPARDLTDDDLRVHIGRIKQGAGPNVVSFVALAHNLVRGAAGAAVKNLELAYEFFGDRK